MPEPAPTTLKVVTMSNEPELAGSDCEGTYTCECARCRDERAKLVRLGVRRSRPLGRPARRAA